MSESFPSAEVSTFSSPLAPSPWSAEDSCPWANAWLLKSCAGIKEPSPMTQRLWEADPPCLPAPRIPEEKGSALCLHAKGPGCICADTGGLMEQNSHGTGKGDRLVSRPSQSASKPQSLFGERRFSKQDTASSSLYRRCGLREETHIWREEWDQILVFASHSRYAGRSFGSFFD